jgi:hypothetical protein
MASYKSVCIWQLSPTPLNDLVQGILPVAVAVAVAVMMVVMMIVAGMIAIVLRVKGELDPQVVVETVVVVGGMATVPRMKDILNPCTAVLNWV